MKTRGCKMFIHELDITPYAAQRHATHILSMAFIMPTYSLLTQSTLATLIRGLF